MSRNRRNKRNLKKITELITSKTFLRISTVLAIIIVVCVITIFYRNYEDKKLLASQRLELEQSIEDIFTATSKSIENSSTSALNTVIRVSAVGDILCGEEMLTDAYQKESKSYYFDNMFQNITNFITKSDIVLQIIHIQVMEIEIVQKNLEKL